MRTKDVLYQDTITYVFFEEVGVGVNVSFAIVDAWDKFFANKKHSIFGGYRCNGYKKYNLDDNESVNDFIENVYDEFTEMDDPEDTVFPDSILSYIKLENGKYSFAGWLRPEWKEVHPVTDMIE